MKKSARMLARLAKWAPLCYLAATNGCLPNDAIRQVFAENIVQTFAVALQAFTALVFGNLFPGI